MADLTTLKSAIAKYLRSQKRYFVIGQKIYSTSELADEVEKETDVGKLIIKMALKASTYDLVRELKPTS
jgi:hypothetical protein